MQYNSASNVNDVYTNEWLSYQMQFTKSRLRKTAEKNRATEMPVALSEKNWNLRSVSRFLFKKCRDEHINEIEQHERGHNDSEGTEETFLECLKVMRDNRQMIVHEA